MWNEANRELFTECLDSLDKDPYVQLMRHVRQHTDGVTRYDHCLCVAYVSFTICRILGWDYRAAARGGLLHDLSPYSWVEEEISRLALLWAHPFKALENARRYGLSEKEEDIIVKHMWPLTPALPSYKESFVVSFADKAAAILEKSHLAKPLGIRKNLRVLTPAFS